MGNYGTISGCNKTGCIGEIIGFHRTLKDEETLYIHQYLMKKGELPIQLFEVQKFSWAICFAVESPQRLNWRLYFRKKSQAVNYTFQIPWIVPVMNVKLIFLSSYRKIFFNTNIRLYDCMFEFVQFKHWTVWLCVWSFVRNLIRIIAYRVSPCTIVQLWIK